MYSLLQKLFNRLMLADKSFRNAVNAVGAIKSNRNQMLEMKTDKRITEIKC